MKPKRTNWIEIQFRSHPAEWQKRAMTEPFDWRPFEQVAGSDAERRVKVLNLEASDARDKSSRGVTIEGGLHLFEYRIKPKEKPKKSKRRAAAIILLVLLLAGCASKPPAPANDEIDAMSRRVHELRIQHGIWTTNL